MRRTTAAGMGRAPAWVTGEEGARTITVTTGNFYMNARPHPGRAYPGEKHKRVVLIIDNAPWHQGR
ncbi:MAG TPA: hypothetical protein VIJ61_20030 [Thermoanaerobaculia bacterium]